MLRMRNKYCSNCLSTQRFLDLGTHLVCERCSKRLEVVAVEESAPDEEKRRQGRVLPWAETAAA